MADFYLPIVDQLQPCEMDTDCLASPEFKGEAALCRGCKWSPAEPESGKDYFKAEKGSRVKFTRRDNAEYQARRDKVADKIAIRAGKSKFRARIGRKAATAEKRTSQSLIKSTRNSGRTNKDGDHNFANKISLDTKLQTGNINPVVNMAELAKIQADARRVGHAIGVLVLRNKNNQAVAVLSEADWQTVLNWLSVE